MIPARFIRILFLIVIGMTCGCSNNSIVTIHSWFTSADQTFLFSKQNQLINIDDSRDPIHIEIDTSKTKQSIEGFGYTLTEASAYLIRRLSPDKKQELLLNLFDSSSTSVGINYLRIGIGATDLSKSVYSYDDLPMHSLDTSLSKFNFSVDSVDLIPLIQEILSVNPDLEIIATPWSAPPWMKNNKSSIGGKLALQHYPTYARYIAYYIQKMKSLGISIEAITPQNEPLNDHNNPSMIMTAQEQLDFIKYHLGPEFRKQGIRTKIIIYDHNCDLPDYPLTILKDTLASQYIDGSAFHLYNGDIGAMTKVHDQFPDKNIYFTEQWTGAKGDFGGDLLWHMKNVVIGSLQNWSKTIFEWNMANDTAYAYHTDGGCHECKGAFTIGTDYKQNVAYFVLAHVSKFVPRGSKVLDTNSPISIPHAIIITPENKMVLIVINEHDAELQFSFQMGDKTGHAKIKSKGVATFVWSNKLE